MFSVSHRRIWCQFSLKRMPGEDQIERTGGNVVYSENPFLGQLYAVTGTLCVGIPGAGRAAP